MTDAKLNSRPDYLARICAVLALMVSMVTGYFTYTMSPLYYGSRPQLSMHYWRDNSGLKKDGLYHSELIMRIENRSNFPAHRVHALVVTPGDDNPQIESEYPHTVSDSRRGLKTIRLDVVPARSTVEVSIKTKVKEGTDDPIHGSDVWLQAPAVFQAFTDNGEIPTDHSKCTDPNPMYIMLYETVED